MKVTKTQSYSVLHKSIHWLSALAIISLFGLGLWMEGLDYYSSWYQKAPALHMGIGFCLVLVTLYRLFGRWRNGVPSPLASHKPWEKWLAHAVHAFFYIAIFSMFMSGYFIATSKGQPLGVFGIIHIPALITESDAPWLKDFAHETHEILAYTIIAIMCLHALGAIKHHIIDKDNTLRRMTR